MLSSYGIAWGAAVNSTKLSYDTLPHMSIRAGVVVAVTFEQIDNAPYAEARADGDNEYLQRVNCGCEKCHSI